MTSAPRPANEDERLAALRRYDILDTKSEREFDDITLLASQICGAPIAAISLVDGEREWFKSKVGVEEMESPRDVAFCAHGILQSDLMVVKDALADERFSDSPLVTEGHRVRFYAGSPLITTDGHALGMLCVKDQTPRDLAPEQIAALQALSRQVVSLLELRRSSVELREAVAQLKEAQEELTRDAAARARLVAILESTTDLVGMADPAGRLTYLNRAGRQLLGFDPNEDVTTTFIADFHPDAKNHPVLTLGLPMAIRHGAWSGEVSMLTRAGKEIPVSQVILCHKGHDGAVEFFSTVVRDVSERKKFEAKLFQSQKLETVGKLAGGIAHEFNSILTAIIGQSELLLDRLPLGTPISDSANEILHAADRAACLTRQLLAYGRKQILQPEVFDLDRVVANMEGLCRNLLGRDVHIQIAAGPGAKMVKADAGQIEQVITNIAMNARDAMPNGGKLTVETAGVSFDEDTVSQYSELKPGHYVMLAITDTGVGMAPEIRARVFEPFFSTKDVGQGTGLGLSTSYGIVKQSGGHISVYSEPGRGTTFKIFLPHFNPPVNNVSPRAAATELPGGTETILLVEDDPALRTMAQTLLNRLGYTVHAAANGIEALSLKQRREVGHIDLLFTDVVMPHMSGKELADRVRSLYPHTRILFTSAYAENAVVHQGVLDEGVTLVQKPFKAGVLAHKLREVLDNGRHVHEANSGH